MTSQEPRQPTTPDPTYTRALKENTWVKIKSCMEAMDQDGFKNGDVVLIRKVREKPVGITTPRGQWAETVSDTQYAIGRKVLVKYSDEEVSSAEGIHLVPHSKLSLTKNRKTLSPEKLTDEVKVPLWLAEAHSWPLDKRIVTLPQWTQVQIVDGPLSKKGGKTDHFSKPSFWNYVVSFVVQKTRIDIQKHSTWIDAVNFDTTAEQEPANPTA